MKNENPVVVKVEQWIIPTYPSPEPEEMPMFAEYRQHQGTSGNPYPNRVVSGVDREHKIDKEYDVVRMENQYIRLAIIPELGGRIFEAYDKTTGYDFLYRQHVIKPALIGAYGSWISGGIEFNWPFHHRPSTFMPVDFFIEHNDDGSAVVWLSEHDPTDRTKGMVGIVLYPDTAFFETRVKLCNRTPVEHSFLWWENGAVRVNKEYQVFFPPDVTYAHHHYRRSHVTFPIAQGEYGGERFDNPTDISMHKNTH
ncbi:MAG: tetratricopeptide 2 repeat protein, partial [Clostridia bacterium]|nr:tetratricopeptide 2 repeat protein [Clostridia bacterium]